VSLGDVVTELDRLHLFRVQQARENNPSYHHHDDETGKEKNHSASSNGFA
jgi:hypothetical protein